MSSTPPPPPPPFTPGPQPGWNQPPAAPQGYELGVPTKPPRPQVKVGAILTIVGGALLTIGAFLPWFESGGVTLNGLDTFIIDDDGIPKKLEGVGGFWIFFGLALLAFGITMLLAGRVLAVAILGIIAGGLGLIFAGTGFGAASDTKEVAEDPDCEDFVDIIRVTDDIEIGCGSGSTKIGLPVGLVGAGLGVAGAITATAKRRRAR